MPKECIPQESAPALILVLNTLRLSPPQPETGNGAHRHPSLSLSLLPLAVLGCQGLCSFAPLPPYCTDLAFVLPTLAACLPMPSALIHALLKFPPLCGSMAGVDLLSQTHTSSWVGAKGRFPLLFHKAWPGVELHASHEVPQERSLHRIFVSRTDGYP